MVSTVFLGPLSLAPERLSRPVLGRGFLSPLPVGQEQVTAEVPVERGWGGGTVLYEQIIIGHQNALEGARELRMQGPSPACCPVASRPWDPLCPL